MKCQLYELDHVYETEFGISVNLRWTCRPKSPDLIFRYSAFRVNNLVGFFYEPRRWWWRLGWRRKLRTSRLRPCIQRFVEGGMSPQVLQLRLEDGAFVVTCHKNNKKAVRANFLSLQRQYNIY
jgi:hypothetical protein